MPSEQPREGTRAEGLVPTESLREAIEQCREMEDPHRYHMLCAKIMSRISCATAPEEPAQPQPRGEGDDLAARLEDLASWLEPDSPFHGTIREAAQLARASTHPEQSARVEQLEAALREIAQADGEKWASIVEDGGTTWRSLINLAANTARAALEPASPTPTEQGEAWGECALCHGTHFYKQPMAAVHGQSVNTICPYCGPPTNDTDEPAQPQPRGEKARVADPTPCDRCGNPIGIVWFADNSLFNEITGTVGVGMLCPTCFDHLAAPRLLTWKAAPVGEQELAAPPRGEGDDLAARDGIGYGGPINFTWEAGGGGYYLTFPNGHERRATATEAQLIAALARTPTVSGLSREDRKALEDLRAAWTGGYPEAAITRALALIDQQEKALEAADRLAEFAEDDAVSRAIVATGARAYRSARATSTKEDG